MVSHTVFKFGRQRYVERHGEILWLYQSLPFYANHLQDVRPTHLDRTPRLRQDRSVAGLGLTLAEGRALLAEVQSVLVSHQAAGRRLDGGPAGMLPLWLSSGAQGHPIDRDAHGVWQSRDTEPEAVDV